jgi:ABC-2 type transport system permease protein
MSSKAIRENPKESWQSESWAVNKEVAPSTIVAAGPTWARIAGSIGLVLLVLGGLTLVLYARAPNQPRLLSPALANLFVILGLGGILYHALVDSDIQVRRLYALLGYALLLVAVFMSWIPSNDIYGARFMPWGVGGFVLGLVLLLAFLRSETEPQLRDYAIYSIGIIGAVMAAIGFVFGSFSWAVQAAGLVLRSTITNSEPFLLSHGVLLILLGLLFGTAFIVLRPKDDPLALRAGLAMGLGGAIFFLIALWRSYVVKLLVTWKWMQPGADYVIPSGMLIMGLGLLYVCVALLLCSEFPLAVLVRRELTRFFCTPIAYIVLVACVTLAGGLFALFASELTLFSDRIGGFDEPIVGEFLWGRLAFVPIVTLLAIVPLLTMGLVSEEKRAGTIEMLLTVRVSEMTIILSKFIGALVVFMLFWLPWAGYLISLRIYGEQPFDYRPLLSFYIAMFFLGFNFVSVGLFFSSLTQNQLTAGILSFLWMMAMIVLFFIQGMNRGNFWGNVLEHTSFINVWEDAVQGKLTLRRLIYNASAGIFFLVASIKVLEIRRWK